MSLKYRPKLKMFKNYNGTNTFDGFEARSYSWYVYAYVIEGQGFMVEKAYSSTTGTHMAELNEVLSGMPVTRILAPSGLNNLSTAVKEINDEIGELEVELTNKRNRNIQQRKDRIENLKTMLLDITKLVLMLENKKTNEIKAA